MKKEEIKARTIEFVKDTLAGDGSGHDWWHVYRVWKMAVHLRESEGGDLLSIELAALLHDIADHKFHGGDLTKGPAVAAAFLRKQGADEALIQRVAAIIGEVSYKGARVADTVSSTEAQIVQDADRLDAIGAIGIARTFAYGGSRNRPLYDPAIPPVMHHDFESYRKSENPTINHFYEKLLLLKERMHTPSAKRIAEERHRFMELFLERFYLEWEADGQA